MNRDMSAPPTLSLELSEHVLRPDQLVAKDASRHRKQVSDERVAQRVPNRNALLTRRDDMVRAQHGEMLGNTRLIESKEDLELLDSAVAPDHELHQPDADRVGKCLEEARLERLQLPDRWRVSHDASLYSNSLMCQS